VIYSRRFKGNPDVACQLKNPVKASANTSGAPGLSKLLVLANYSIGSPSKRTRNCFCLMKKPILLSLQL
jgi:hypothetical protein